ncbi:HD domain-containing protein [Psychromarinibacter sp. C21-152]|uniref:HD domain-containing protein n=1 Tax=Psychromarinibacter sediminicola TaxID=3033385 RepID=A0AAE3NMV1_9RHOB|nr:HD domain-containing protein [Psychromarinibacter sediminicola]MDF0599166.1 HD domain-containing protein [Psychromarinibacter sediminicola]
MTRPDALSADTIVPFLAEIFARRGAEEYLGEPVTISEHMRQCAELAEREGAGDELIAAALLHDIGHFTHEFPADAAAQDVDTRHEAAGARVVARFFPTLVTDCVRYHVDAKRYLCATDPDYAAKLSDASVHSLKLQGGPMSDEEVAAFEKTPHLDAILKVRIWDDIGKDPDHAAPAFAHYAPVLRRVVRTHRL